MDANDAPNLLDTFICHSRSARGTRCRALALAGSPACVNHAGLVRTEAQQEASRTNATKHPPEPQALTVLVARRETAVVGGLREPGQDVTGRNVDRGRALDATAASGTIFKYSPSCHPMWKLSTYLAWPRSLYRENVSTSMVHRPA